MTYLFWICWLIWTFAGLTYAYRWCQDNDQASINLMKWHQCAYFLTMGGPIIWIMAICYSWQYICDEITEFYDKTVFKSIDVIVKKI